MKPHSVVVVNLHTPREKFWGELLEINPAGITLQGIDLNAFDEWLNQVRRNPAVGMTTVFFPLCRVERVELDEPSGEVPSLSETFHQRTGRSFAEYLNR